MLSSPVHPRMSEVVTDPERRFVESRAAERRTGIPETTLRNWRSQGRGPRYVRVGRRVYYDISVLDEWMLSQTVEPCGRASR